MEEAFRVSGVDDFGADVPPSVVDISRVSADVDSIRRGFDDVFIGEARPDQFQIFVVIVTGRVTSHTHTASPLGFLNSK